MQSFSKKWVFAKLAIIAICLAGPAAAAPITLTFNGTIVNQLVDSNGALNVTTTGYSSQPGLIGGAFSMSVQTDTTPFIDRAGLSFYNGLISYDIGIATGSVNYPLTTVSVQNSDASGTDQIAASIFANSTLSSGIAGFEISSIIALLRDDDGTALSSTAIPNAINVSDFDFSFLGLISTRQISFDGECGRRASFCTERLLARMDSVTVSSGDDLSTVPLPAGIVGLMTGLAALGGLRRRRKA